MASDYLNSSQAEAKDIAKTLRQVDLLLASNKLRDVYQSDATELRRKVKTMLADINTSLNDLSDLEAKHIFKTNPVFATQRHQLIERIETAKIDFEFDIVPALESLTRQVVENSKQNPSMLVKNPNESWTAQKILDQAGQFVDQAARAGTILIKAYGLAQALGLVLGIPLPPIP